MNQIFKANFKRKQFSNSFNLVVAFGLDACCLDVLKVLPTGMGHHFSSLSRSSWKRRPQHVVSYCCNCYTCAVQPRLFRINVYQDTMVPIIFIDVH